MAPCLTVNTEDVTPRPGRLSPPALLLAGALVGALTALCLYAVPTALSARADDATRRAAGLRIADRLLALQDAHGALPDAPGAGVANTDSCMEYALWGLAAAYSETGDMRYLTGLRRGVSWLAQRVVMTPGPWRGSFWYAYSARPPYAHVKVSPGGRIADVRGVDASSALLAYDLWLYTTLSGDRSLARHLKPRIQAAIDFVLKRDRSAGGFFWSSWQRRHGETRWRLYRYQYAADQADVLLGLDATWRLYGNARAHDAAVWLRAHVAAGFFLSADGRFAMGREQGERDRALNGFDGIFPQGYLPWVLGTCAQTSTAHDWLTSHQRPAGDYRCYAGDPGFSLSVDIDALAAAALDAPPPHTSLDWLLATTYHQSGAVGDSATHPGVEYSNVDGFTALVLLGPPAGPFSWSPPGGARWLATR